MKTRLVMAVAVALTVAGPFAQSTVREQIARGIMLWDQRLAKSAIAALESAARSRPTPAEAAEIHEALGRIYTFKGWQQEAVFPGWHDEPALRVKALAELKAAVAADPTRSSALEALRMAEGFAAADSVDPAPPRPEVRALDARLQATGPTGSDPKSGLTVSDPKSGSDTVLAAVDARAQAQADPAPYFAGAQILLDRGEFDRAIALAERGAAASDKFIDENLGAYQLSGKSQGSYARGRATAADLVGWALFLEKDYPAARAKLEESARLSQDQDFVNQFHLGELARAQNDTARARERYLNALSLAGGPAPLRQRATQALSGLHAGGPNAETGFDAWLEAELTRRRDDRKTDALKSLVDRPLPTLTLTTVDGKPFDASTLQGKVVLLNFFASWCGLCRAELPNLKAAYPKYQNDPGVAFLLLSIDEDDKRLKRYLNEMKFPFPVARITPAQAAQLMGVDNTPMTFYVDRRGVVRYQTNGSESHGDSASRVGWFIDQLKS